MANDRETVEISMTLPKDWVEESLLPSYPAATRASQAARMSVQSDIKRQEKELASGEIAESLVNLIKEGGGSWENVQRVEINNVGEIEVDGADATSDGEN